jgi:lipid II:glycine glycyltransferase (peptidoglycan interpeptide bridge formation enzyme)
MAKITLNTVESEKEWESFLSKHHDANFLQSWYWGKFHEAMGHRVHRTGFYNDDKLVGVMLSVVEDAKRGKYLTVPAGPIINWDDSDQVKAFVNEIKTIAKLDGCVFVRVRPQLKSSGFSKGIFAKYGFINAPMHLHAELTHQLDITKPEDELLADMRKTTRYEIRKAISLGIKVTTSDDPSSLMTFYELQVETARRQAFVPFSYKFLEEQFKVFSKIGKVLLYSTALEGKLLAQAFIIFYGQEAAYHYGASTEDGRKYPGAYLIQWEAIKEAQKRSMTRYNFWGVAPEDQKDHRFYGVSVFKRGFGGQDIDYLHAQDLIINKLKYVINYTVESIRKKVRKV